MDNILPRIICIVGPTASGKTALGIELAKKFNGEIISADSRMVFRGMEIGSAVPAGEAWVTSNGLRATKIEGIDHYMIGIVNPDQPFTVAEWKRQTVEIINDIILRGKVPFIVGGTGLYVSALVDNFDIPRSLPNNELRIRNQDLGEMVKKLLELDPDAKKLVDLKNPRRVIRALEVCLETGKPFTQQLLKKPPILAALQIGISQEKDVLAQRIYDRLDQQIKDGLIEEVKVLEKQYGRAIPTMQGFVYREVSQYLNSEITLDQARGLICLHTRQYAKRQMTWFKRDKRIVWLKGGEEAVEMIGEFLLGG